MLGKLLKKPTSADLLQAVHRAKGVVAEKRAAVAAAEAAVAAALETLDADGHEKATTALGAARSMLASAEAFADAASKQHTTAVAAEAEAAWRRDAAAYDRAVAEFEKSTRAALDEMAAAARRLVGRSAELEANWRDLAARRPADAEPPKHPEGWRHVAATEDEVLDEKVSPEWVYASTGRPISEDAARRVTAHEGGRTGWFSSGSGFVDVVRRTVRRRTIRPRRPVMHAEPLAAALAIPGATAADRPGWAPVPPDEIAAALARLAAPPAPPAVETRVEVEVLPG